MRGPGDSLPGGAQSPRSKHSADETWLPRRAGAAVAQSRVHLNSPATNFPPSGCFIVAVPESLPLGGGPVTLQIVCTGGDAPTSFTWQGPGVNTQTTDVVSASITSTATFTATASNMAGTAPPATKTVTVQTASVQLSPPSLPNGTVNTPYSRSFSATGGTAPYTFSRTAGTLPAGLQLVGNVLSGSPTTAGDYSFRITLTDSGGNSAGRDYSVRIVDSPITLPPAALPAATANAPETPRRPRPAVRAVTCSRLGATAVLPRGVSGYFNYQYLFGNDNYRSSRYTLGLRAEF